jgi:Ca2+/Na+ antiporter
MEQLLNALASIAFIMLIIGFFKPSISLFFLAEKDQTRKHSAILYILLWLVFVVFATSSAVETDNKDNNKEPDTSENTKPDPDPVYTDDDIYIQALQEAYPQLSNSFKQDREVYIEYAKSSCIALEAGATSYDIFDVIYSTSDDPLVQEILAYAIGAGVSLYCPDYLPVIIDQN